MITVTTVKDTPHWQQKMLLWLHLAVLAGSVALITLISYDTFRNVSFIENQKYLQAQFWICLLFLFDIVMEFLISPRKWHYFITHLFFFIISIPYINILDFYGVHMSGELVYAIRFIPIVRAAYVLAIITGALSSNRISSMFIAYIALLLSIVYFSSMMFFVEEHIVNPDCTSYPQALWWAIMCMTTAGSYVGEYTVTGKVLSVILSGGGLILFPVFTVYITHAVAGTPDDNSIGGNSQNDDASTENTAKGKTTDTNPASQPTQTTVTKT